MDKGESIGKKAERHGKILMIVSSASILVWLFLSSGYDPKSSMVGNFYNTLNIYHSQWFCKPVFEKNGSRTLNPRIRELLGLPPSSPIKPKTKLECSDIIIQTKYLILLSFVSAVYGFLIQKRLVENRIPAILRGLSNTKEKIKSFFKSPV